MNNKLYKLAGVSVAICAALVAVAVLVGGFASALMPLLGVCLFYALLALGLFKQMRLVAYIAFIVMLVAAIAAYIMGSGEPLVPSWVFYAIAVFEVLAAVLLFCILWKNKLPNRQASREEPGSV